MIVYSIQILDSRRMTIKTVLVSGEHSKRRVIKRIRASGRMELIISEVS